MTVLFHPDGRSLTLEDTAWKRALDLALAAGWTPGRTLAPPPGIGARNEAWDGRHEPAAGQEVTRADAARFAAALAGSTGPEWVGVLARFAAKSGFLVCGAEDGKGAVTGSLLRLAEGLRFAAGIEETEKESVPVRVR